jgi:outer membrane protein TolC
MIKNNFLALIFLFVPLCFFAQSTTVIDYATFIENVKKNNPIASKAQNFSDIGRAQYNAARGNYDPIISASTENKYYNSTGYYSLFSADLKQPLFTSQYLKAGYEYGSGVFVNPEQYTSSYGLPYLGLEVSLLQGFSIDKRRAEVLKAENYMDYYNAEKNIVLNELLYFSSQAYFEWMYTQKQFALYSYFLSLADLRLQGVKFLSNSGERPAVDTIEAAVLLQSRLLDQQAVAIENQKQFNELTSFNWQNNTTPNSTAINFISKDSLDNCFQRVKKIALEIIRNDSINNPLVMQYRAKQKVLEVEERFKKEMIKPKLDITYNFLSSNKNSYAPVFSPNNYKWGATLSFPLFLRNPINEYKIASLNADNNAYDLANKTNEIGLKQNYLKQTLVVLTNQLSTAEKSVLYSKNLLEAEKLKFDNGESSLFMLNTRENKLLETELKLADSKLKFIKCILGIIYLNGTLEYAF